MDTLPLHRQPESSRDPEYGNGGSLGYQLSPGNRRLLSSSSIYPEGPDATALN